MVESNDPQQLLQKAQNQANEQEALRQQNNTIVKIELTLSEVNTVLQVLNNGPFNQVLSLINSITNQAQAQIQQQRSNSQQPSNNSQQVTPQQLPNSINLAPIP